MAAYLWGYANSQPIAELKNATWQQAAYAGFEWQCPGGGWSWSGTTQRDTLHARTGTCCLSLGAGGSLSATLSPVTGSYLLSFWCKTVASSTTATVQGAGVSSFVTDTWHYVEKVVTLGTLPYTLSVSGSTVLLDDVRLYPTQAQLTSYTYELPWGISSVSGVDGQPTFSEYDSFGRLLRVRDVKGRIRKQHTYHYVQLPH